MEEARAIMINTKTDHLLLILRFEKIKALKKTKCDRMKNLIISHFTSKKKKAMFLLL